MKKKVHEQVWPTLLVSALGFGLLAVAVPEWARYEVILFGGLYSILVTLMDEDVRMLFVRSKPGKQPASRRAAT
jgi:hypothetical protein